MEIEADMGAYIHFIGVGDTGNKTAIELTRIYEGIRNSLLYEEHDKPHNHLHIHSYHGPETFCYDGEEHFIILAGSAHDSGLLDARNAVHERRPFLMLTIRTDYQAGINTKTFQPFPDEFLIVPDQSLFDPVAVAQLVLQIFFIHTPWQVCSRGSLIGYGPADTKSIFAGKVAKVKIMTAYKEHYQQNFSKFLDDNKADLSQAKGILMSFWGRDDVLSIPETNDLWEETRCLLMPDARQVFTYHVFEEEEPAFMVTLFLAL